MKTIGITGGTGFIGQYFLRAYADRFRLKVATQRNDTTTLFCHPHIEYCISDYGRDSFAALFAGCDAVIHLAAKRPTPEAEQSLLNYANNIAISEALFDVCAELNLGNVINISSRSVYDAVSKEPHRESEAAKPYNYYGTAKLCVESIAEIYNQKYGMCIKSLRLGQVLGLGERRSMQTVFLEKALRGEVLQVYGSGTALRQFIYVKDVCLAIMAALECRDSSGVFNICSSETLTNRDIALKYCEVFENKAGIRVDPAKPEDGFFPLLDVSKAMQVLGFTPSYDFCSALRDMRKDFFRQHVGI